VDPQLDLTSTLNTSAAGADSGRASQILPQIYDDLRHLAERYFRGERADHMLQPTALVHEAYLRLVDQSRISPEGRTHFFALCAKTMRRVLVDYARGRDRIRRGGGRRLLEIDDNAVASNLSDGEILELNDALEKLGKLDARQEQVVELRFFGGMNMDEIAQTMGVSKRTVEGDWTHAKAWLRSVFFDESAA
jgi:RNA polymerase sigma factor (TIGR02999 family)